MGMLQSLIKTSNFTSRKECRWYTSVFLGKCLPVSEQSCSRLDPPDGFREGFEKGVGSPVLQLDAEPPELELYLLARRQLEPAYRKHQQSPDVVSAIRSPAFNKGSNLDLPLTDLVQTVDGDGRQLMPPRSARHLSRHARILGREGLLPPAFARSMPPLVSSCAV